MIEKVKQQYSKGLEAGKYILFNRETGEEELDVINRKAFKTTIKYEFMKFNIEHNEELVKLLGKVDYNYFRDLSDTCSKYGVIEHNVLDKFISVDRRRRKVKKFKDMGLIDKLLLKGWSKKYWFISKKYWFINPYLCHKSKEVLVELSDNFKKPDLLFKKLY